ncbi:MAG: hypothetical protein JWL59_4135 [Chthoniobacteraceae bacterium]|nr:hypothetical protein [Chthoniobacteraceae bacterium]
MNQPDILFQANRFEHAAGASKSRVSRFKILAVSLMLTASSSFGAEWTLHNTHGPRPSERSTPAVSAIGTQVYLFGGVFDNFSAGVDTFYNDLFKFDALKDKWVKLRPNGPIPAARAFAASAAQEESGRFFVFGGSSYGPDFSDFHAFDDLWVYSTGSNAWSQIHAINAGPSGRSRPALWLVGSKMYVFGGITDSFATLNDLWVYNLNSNAWTLLIADGAAGSPPSRHEAISGSRHRFGKLVIYGGETLSENGFEILADTWEYNIACNRWDDITPAPRHNIDPSRNFAGAGILGGDLYLHGGDLPGGSNCCGAPFPQNVSDELWKFDLQDGNWRQVTRFRGDSPQLKRHRGVEIGSDLFLFGGYNFVDGIGQVWNLDVFSFRP